MSGNACLIRVRIEATPEVDMKRLFSLLVLCSMGLAIEPVTAVHGTVTKIDSKAKTIVIKTADETEHTVKFIGKTAVHGTEAGAKDTFKGVKEGSEVVAHYTVKGSEATAVEVDKVGDKGLKATEGTVSAVDRGPKRFRSRPRTEPNNLQDDRPCSGGCR